MSVKCVFNVVACPNSFSGCMSCWLFHLYRLGRPFDRRGRGRGPPPHDRWGSPERAFGEFGPPPDIARGRIPGRPLPPHPDRHGPEPHFPPPLERGRMRRVSAMWTRRCLLSYAIYSLPWKNSTIYGRKWGCSRCLEACRRHRRFLRRQTWWIAEDPVLRPIAGYLRDTKCTRLIFGMRGGTFQGGHRQVSRTLQHSFFN